MAKRRLSYASTGTRRPAPAYGVVLGVLASAFLLAFGGALVYAMVGITWANVTTGSPPMPWWGFAMFIPTATAFLWGGVAQMRAVVRELRGTNELPPFPPEDHLSN